MFIEPDNTSLQKTLCHVKDYGIVFTNMLYMSSELKELWQTPKDDLEVEVRYDPCNLDRIYVFDPSKQSYITVKCSFISSEMIVSPKTEVLLRSWHMPKVDLTKPKSKTSKPRRRRSDR